LPEVKFYLRGYLESIFDNADYIEDGRLIVVLTETYSPLLVCRPAAASTATGWFFARYPRETRTKHWRF